MTRVKNKKPAKSIQPIRYEWRRPDGVALMQYVVPPHMDLGQGWIPDVMRDQSEVHCFRREPGKRWELKLVWKKAEMYHD